MVLPLTLCSELLRVRKAFERIFFDEHPLYDVVSLELIDKVFVSV